MLPRMAVQSVHELLATLSRSKLEAMEKGIDAKIADLRTEKELVGRALAAKGVTRPKTTPSNTDDKATKRRNKRGGRGTGSSQVLRTIIEEQPDRIWMPIEIIHEAHSRGVTSRDQAIRVALRRMGERGILRRGPNDEGWQFAASQNGSSGEPSDQTSPPEGHETVGGGEMG